MGSHHQHHHEEASRRRLAIALALIAALMAIEVAIGAITHSLAVLSDAGHMLSDAGALGFSLLAARLAARPASGAMTYGLRRAEILSAQANGVTLLIIGVLIAYTGARRLVSPVHVDAWPVLAVALIGVLVNLAATTVLAGGGPRGLNVEGSYQHLLSDLYAFAATAVAALVILASGFARADALASLLIAALMLRSGSALVLASGRVFLEAAPRGLDPQAIGTAMAASPGIVEVHDLHVWEVTSGFASLSAHVLVGAQTDCHAARRDLEALLRERFSLRHTTLQMEHAGADELLRIEVTAAPPRGIS